MGWIQCGSEHGAVCQGPSVQLNICVLLRTLRSRDRSAGKGKFHPVTGHEGLEVE